MHTRCVLHSSTGLFLIYLYIYIYIITLCRISPCSFSLTESRPSTQRSLLLWQKFVKHDCYFVSLCTDHVFVCMFVFWIAFCTLKLQFTLYFAVRLLFHTNAACAWIWKNVFHQLHLMTNAIKNDGSLDWQPASSSCECVLLFLLQLRKSSCALER